MATVDSVEIVAVALGGTDLTAATNLTGGQTLANCVPFATLKTNIGSSNWHKRMGDVALAASPDRVVVTRETASGNMDVSAGVVEFGSGVTIQSGTFTIPASSTTTTEAITAVVLANTFVVIFMEANDRRVDRSMSRVYFSSTTELTFVRGLGQVGDITTGHWFVVEADSDTEFAVQSWSIDMTSSTSNTATLTAVTMASIMLMCSAHSEYGGGVPDIAGMRVRLSATTTVTADRDTSTSDAFTISGFSVEFGGAEAVQRGVHTWLGGEGDQSSTITAVDADLAMAWNPHPHAGTTSDGSLATDGHQAWSRATLSDTTTVVQSRGGNTTAGDAGWEVIEWELVAGGAALVEVIDEVVQVLEGTVRSMAMSRFANEVVEVVESADENAIVRALVMVRVLNETVQVPETSLRARVMARIVDELVQVLEGAEQHRAIVKLIAEVVEVSEIIAHVLATAIVQIINETVEVVESVEQHRAIVQLIAEVLEVAETLVRSRAMTRILSEDLEVEETTLRSRVMVRLTSDVVEIVESTLGARGLVRLINEVIEILETTGRIFVIGGEAPPVNIDIELRPFERDIHLSPRNLDIDISDRNRDIPL